MGSSDEMYSLGMEPAGLMHLIAIDDAWPKQSRVLSECSQW